MAPHVCPFLSNAPEWVFAAVTQRVQNHVPSSVPEKVHVCHNSVYTPEHHFPLKLHTLPLTSMCWHLTPLPPLLDAYRMSKKTRSQTLSISSSPLVLVANATCGWQNQWVVLRVASEILIARARQSRRPLTSIIAQRMFAGIKADSYSRARQPTFKKRMDCADRDFTGVPTT